MMAFLFVALMEAKIRTSCLNSLSILSRTKAVSFLIRVRFHLASVPDEIRKSLGKQLDRGGRRSGIVQELSLRC